MPEARITGPRDANDALPVSLYAKEITEGDTPLRSKDGTLSILYSNTGPVSDGSPSNVVQFLKGDGSVGAVAFIARLTVYNGASWDGIRGNTELTLLASAARTATTNSSDQTNHNARGVIAFLNVTAVPGVDTVTLHIQGKDPVSGNYRTVASTAAYDATGTRYLVCYPGATDTGNKADGKNDLPLPRTWRVQVMHSGAGSFTYSVGASLIL